MRAALASIASLAVLAQAHGGGWDRHHQRGQQCHGMWHQPGRDTSNHVSTNFSGNSTFSQLVDHSNPGLGTFSQLYYYDYRHWKGPGSPVVFFTPGEINITGYDTYLSVQT